MTGLLILLALSSVPIPTGPAGTPMTEMEGSPMELSPASFQAVRTLEGSRGTTVMVVVADYVSSSLAPQIAQFQSDIAAEGWTVEVFVMSGGSVEDLRSLFQGQPDLDGAILVGFLPCAWFSEDYWGIEEFPCELFLMDLDGTWTDSDMDGLYDQHTGDVAPEIWVGRIDAHSAFGPELMLLSEYFNKNHLYRTGAMGLSATALAFNDDDWGYYEDCGLCDIYDSGAVTVVNSSSQTTAENYLLELQQGYEFVHLMSHSCPWGHTFKVSGGMAGTVMAPEISQVNPNTAFLQLFSCSNARWIEEGCLGNWYLFGTDFGLLVTGAAKTGSMLDFEQYYGPLASGSCFGEAFRDWWEYEAQGGFSAYERAWFYGNALLGDPTLKPLGGGRTENSGHARGRDQMDYAQLSTSEYSDCFPAAASNEDSPRDIVAAWVSGENGRLDVAACCYHEGTGWDPVIYVDTDEYWDVDISACYHDTSPWIAWSDFEYSTFSYCIKTACGPSFSQVEVQVEQEGYQLCPVLASDGNRLWLAWLDWDACGGAVMVKSIDGVFPATQVSSPGTWCENPDMIIDNAGTVIVTWEERDPSGSDIMTCHGNSGGFSAPVQVSSGTICHSPSLDHQWSDSGTRLVWVEEDASSSILATGWEGDAWGPVETLYVTGENVSGVYSGALPEPHDQGVIWQEGTGAGAAIMALAEGMPEPVELIPFSGPAWKPVSTSQEIFWAGDQGDGWEIYFQYLSGLGTGPGDIEEHVAHPLVMCNPVYGSLVIGLPEGSREFQSEVRLYDLAGRNVLSAGVSLQPGSSVTIDCSGLPSGVYMVDYSSGAPPDRFLLLR